ncbi:hypothetical protein [Afipia felis]|uniref:hypothetical protein n=1 Tax=Afipia felis TaxID=1035 RepID=UPI001AEBBEE0|nr:hypothetical protein [Afipia felis]
MDQEIEAIGAKASLIVRWIYMKPFPNAEAETIPEATGVQPLKQADLVSRLAERRSSAPSARSISCSFLWLAIA